MGVAERLRDDAADLWEACYEHPFVQGIARGDLDADVFRSYLTQDYAFLIEYARVLAFASAKAPTLDAQTHFAELTTETLASEMDLHRKLCAEWGISAADLEEVELGPTTSGYTSFLVKTAAAGSYGELVAALLPCQWGYADIGQRLARRGRPDHPRYAAWIDAYSSDEFASLARWLVDHANEVGDGIDDAAYARWRTCFRTSLRYEHAFWEMAWVREDWPR